MTTGPVLSVRNIRRSFGAHAALDGVSLDVAEGEVVAVIGPSGSGKSTLVRCVHQLEPIDSGAMYLDGDLLGYEHSGAGLRPCTRTWASLMLRSTVQWGKSWNCWNTMPMRRRCSAT